MIGCRIENCEKEYVISGYVVDAEGVAISDVDLKWRNYSSSEKLTKTEKLGSFKILYKTRSTLQGQTLDAIKEGYKNGTTEVFSENEAGEKNCGTVNIMRNFTLQKR